MERETNAEGGGIGGGIGGMPEGMPGHSTFNIRARDATRISDASALSGTLAPSEAETALLT